MGILLRRGWRRGAQTATTTLAGGGTTTAGDDMETFDEDGVGQSGPSGVFPVAYGVVWCLPAMRLDVPCLAFRVCLLLRHRPVAYGVVGDLEWLSIKVTVLGFLSLCDEKLPIADRH
jgi:hypothetical protein